MENCINEMEKENLDVTGIVPTSDVVDGIVWMKIMHRLWARFSGFVRFCSG